MLPQRPRVDNVTCIRCGDAPSADEGGYCGHCHWAVLIEVQDGLHELDAYLAAWARFADWCRAKDGSARS
jgi:hypothetical protein